MKVDRQKPVKITMTSKGFGGDARAILTHPNVQKDLQKARTSKLARALEKNRK